MIVKELLDRGGSLYAEDAPAVLPPRDRHDLVPASRFVTMDGVEQALSPPARVAATTSGLPGMC
jgi:hypothetical protein